MEIFLTTTVIFALIFLVTRRFIINFKDGKANGSKKGLLLMIVLSEISVFLAITVSGGEMYEGAACIAVGLVGFYSVTLSFLSRRVADQMLILTVTIEVLYVLYRVLIFVLGLPSVPIGVFLYITMAVPVVLCVLYCVSVAVKIADIKFVLHSGAVWNSVCISTDLIYLASLVVYTSVYFMIAINQYSVHLLTASIYSFLLISIQYAISLRITGSSIFVIWTEHERRIIESMRLNHSELAGESPGVDALYKNIYDRVLDYFESHRPYLNHDLTINDIVKVLYTNKLYISKAICMYTGRNFCQFVNFYRITYAVEAFRKDTTLKVVDIASRSGFNSSVSFSMAFRLYMSEKPSDWFRRERARLAKGKK